MDQARLVIAIALSILIFLLWNLFFVDKETEKKSAKKIEAPPATKEQPAKETPYIAEAHKKAPAEEQGTQTKVPQPSKIARTLTVETPLYRAEISEKGAVFVSFLLKKYREKVSKDSPLKEILSGDVPQGTGQLGFAGKSVPGLEDAIFSTNFTASKIAVNDSIQEISFYWQSDQDIVVEKTYKFAPDSYVIGLDVAVKNASDQTIQDQLFLALRGQTPQGKRRYAFEGPSALINDKLEEIKIKKIKEHNTFDGKIKWIALQDRYFMTGIIPQQVEEASLRLFLNSDKIIEARYAQPEKIIRPGTQYKYEYQLFLGPKSMKILNNVGHDLGKVVDFGIFDFIAKPCVWLMNLFYGVIPNYGVAIIILTLLVKILLWPLGTKSYKSMSEMKKIQPLMKEIREKYKNDKKKMNQEVMGLYRTYKINPLGGCLPMVVQIPVFFALYRMLYEAIELRHAHFFLWINDLSAPDRLFRFNFSIPFMEPPYGIPVLTIIMGATMLLQQKMSPPMGDPTQAKMMMLMPIVFTVIFINFSSGLVLYWLINNLLSISQQYYIQKKYA